MGPYAQSSTGSLVAGKGGGGDVFDGGGGGGGGGGNSRLMRSSSSASCLAVDVGGGGAAVSPSDIRSRAVQEAMAARMFLASRRMEETRAAAAAHNLNIDIDDDDEPPPLDDAGGGGGNSSSSPRSIPGSGGVSMGRRRRAAVALGPKFGNAAQDVRGEHDGGGDNDDASTLGGGNPAGINNGGDERGRGGRRRHGGRSDRFGVISTSAAAAAAASAAMQSSYKRDAVQKLFDQVSLKSIVGMMRYDDEDVRLHAVKVIANLAADSHNQGRIVEEGGVQALLDILGSGERGGDNGEATCRIAAGALANLAMREANQLLILDAGAVELLALFAHDAREPQSHRMVAGAVANLCGNNQVEAKLHAAGGLALLVSLSRSSSPDVLAQVGRGLANYSRCDAGRRRMVREGALPRVVTLANQDSTFLPGERNSAARRHAQVALCEMAMDVKNAPAVAEQPGATEILEEIAEHTSGGLRKAATKALAVIGQQRGANASANGE